MKQLWVICGVLLLAGCQGEESQPVTKPAESVATPAALPPVEAQPAGKEVPPTAALPAAPAPAGEKLAVAKPAPIIAPTKQAPPAPLKQEEAPAPAVVVVPPDVVPEAPASDEEVLALARKNNCFACHALDKKVVGPGWKSVAAKYRGDANAQTYLENKIAKGGGGVWGGTPMPPQPKLSAVQRSQLAKFILNLQ